MKAKEMRDLSTEEMKKRVLDLKSELLNLRFQLAIKQLENPMRIRQVKKDIARLLTIITERSTGKVNSEANRKEN